LGWKYLNEEYCDVHSWKKTQDVLRHCIFEGILWSSENVPKIHFLAFLSIESSKFQKFTCLLHKLPILNTHSFFQRWNDPLMSNKAENLNSIFGANSLALYRSSQIWLMPSQTGCDMASPSKIMNRIMPRGEKRPDYFK